MLIAKFQFIAFMIIYISGNKQRQDTKPSIYGCSKHRIMRKTQKVNKEMEEEEELKRIREKRVEIVKLDESKNLYALFEVNYPEPYHEKEADKVKTGPKGQKRKQWY